MERSFLGMFMVSNESQLAKAPAFISKFSLRILTLFIEEHPQNEYFILYISTGMVISNAKLPLKYKLAPGHRGFDFPASLCSAVYILTNCILHQSLTVPSKYTEFIK